MSNLALELRPQNLEQVIGQDHIKRAIKSFAEKDNWPNVFLFYGPPGTGKTTLALIVAKMCGAEGDGLHEINASAENGVDAARQLADMSASLPFVGRRRVFILNEFHQYTGPAQNVLKDPMEKNSALWILTTDRPEKIEPAIKSRAAAATFEVKPLSDQQMVVLCEKALLTTDPAGTWQPKTDQAAAWLYKNGIRQPREILGAMDLFFTGLPIEECVHGNEHEPLYKDVASAVLSGNWTKASAALSQIKTADSRGLIAITSAFLRSELLKNPVGPRADALATCLVGLDNLGYADGTAYGGAIALLYKVARAVNK